MAELEVLRRRSRGTTWSDRDHWSGIGHIRQPQIVGPPPSAVPYSRRSAVHVL
jgi:hypothetical protein